MSRHINYVSRFICWILPLLALLLIALYLMLSPVVFTYTAAPQGPHNVVASHEASPKVFPDVFWPFN